MKSTFIASNSFRTCSLRDLREAADNVPTGSEAEAELGEVTEERVDKEVHEEASELHRAPAHADA